MAEAGTESAEFLRFAAQGSSNYDDSGFFSSQVIEAALKIWGITVAPISAPDMEPARREPLSERAFVCWLDSHWFTIRKVGGQWWDLNSMHTAPRRISDTHLGMLLLQLQSERYTIFVARGPIPEGDPAVAMEPSGDDAVRGRAPARRRPRRRADDGPQGLAAAIADSLRDAQQRPQAAGSDAELQEAIALSLRAGAASAPEVLDAAELRRRRLARFGGGT